MCNLGVGPGRCARAHDAPDTGTVTAEMAVILPGLTVILAVLLAGFAAGITQFSVQEAARAAARELARGESSQVAASTARRLAGSEAEVYFSGDGTWAEVHVTKEVPGPASALIDWPLTATASARREPGADVGAGGTR